MIGFKDPVCDSFKSKIRNDQLCYEVDLEKERLKTVGGAANLFQSFRHMSAFLALGTIYLQLLT